VEGSAGPPSLENALKVAAAMLAGTPANYVSRELLVVASSSSLVDPGDVFAAVEKVRAEKVRCSVVHTAVLMEVYRKLAEKTEGRFGVARDAPHLAELLAEHLTPPPASRAAALEGAGFCSFVKMGFPAQHLGPSAGSSAGDTAPAYCADVDAVHPAPYYCPRCQAPTPALPSTCRVCALPLIANSHLARSYHHLFPVPPFDVVGRALAKRDPAAAVADACRACGERFPPPPLVVGAARERGDDAMDVVREGRAPPRNGGDGAAADEGGNDGDDDGDAVADEARRRCPKCAWVFCEACDGLIHESLFACPGCVCLEGSPERAAAPAAAPAAESVLVRTSV